MLREAGGDEFEDSDRPLKRRRVNASTETAPPRAPEQLPSPEQVAEQPTASPRPGPSNLQTVEESSEDDGSEFEFEDVDLGGKSEDAAESADEIEDLAIAVQSEKSKKPAAAARRKPATFAEKAHRLMVHKMHVLDLLGHCMYVNGRCNNAVVQRHLRPLLSDKTISYLNPKTTDTQFQRNRSFMDGLQQALDSFNANFRVTSGGMTKARWEVDGEAERKYDPLPPMDRSDFIAAAKDLEGSQDVANQLFCALLRSVGVDTRLICSLQVLPFTSVPKAATPKKPMKETVFAMAPDVPRDSKGVEDSAVRGSASIGKVPSARRRLGQPSFAAEPTPVTTPKKKIRPVPKLSYPVFWVETFNTAQQKWIPVDAMVTHTVNKAAKLEPPSSYDLNHMAYVIAFEDDGTARDVTKRYAKAYNAKTRRHRVEASADGARWFKKAMRIFRRRKGALDRDQVEDAELAQKEAKEGMPANVLDFKDHPYYALERHLKRHEVIHPRREVGKVNAGTAAKPRIEPVYRRQDVLICKSAEKWYRVGREIKEGEQPLKRVPARARRQRSVDEDDADGAVAETTLYAPYQTQLYVPPPVQRGRIPRNAFGNLDVYVPSMVPAGGVHIRHQLVQQAAKLLRIDYADAVTGFKFQGRHGTAIVEGAVVAEQYADAVRAVIEGFEEQIIEDESRLRSLEALKLWKRFLTALKIKERVSAYGAGSAESEDEDQLANVTPAAPAQDDKPLVTAGLYTLQELQAPSRKPKPRKQRPADDSEHEWGPQGSQPEYDADEEMEDAGLAGGFVQTDAVANPVEYGTSGGFVPAEDEGGGGFFAEDADDEGGGFVADDGEDGGGGFLSANDHGGGFLPAGDQNSTESLLDKGKKGDDYHPSEHDHEAVVPEVNSDDDGGGFLPDAYEQMAVATESCQAVGVEAPVSNAHEQDPAPEQEPEASQTTAARMEEAGGQASENDANDDNSSLPSHDPEDDDAEPDWLESD